MEFVLRDRPFHLKGRKKILSANLIEKKVLSMNLAEKKYTESTRCLKKKLVFVEKNNVETTCSKTKFPLCHESRKKKFDLKKWMVLN